MPDCDDDGHRATNSPAVISVERLAVTYPKGVRALRPTTLTFSTGSFVVLLGPSGAGKSTLLRSLNGLVAATEGCVVVAGLGRLSEAGILRRHRRRTGMIFQSHQLIGRSTALANVLMGRLGYHSWWRTMFGLSQRERRLALSSLDRVGLFDKALFRVDVLSGGQRQRVGIARALCQEPCLILADEPVASLDPATAAAVLTDLKQICSSAGITAVVSLHQVELARQFADRVIGLADGGVVADVPASALTDAVVDQIYRGGRRTVPSSSDRTADLQIAHPALLEASL